MAASAFRLQGLSARILSNSNRLVLRSTQCGSKRVQVVTVLQSRHQSSQSPAEKEAKAVTKTDEKPVPLERFIPITRRSMVRHMMQAKEYLNTDELSKFERFAEGVDSAVINRYHSVLQELKSLFDPINPDKDTIVTRQFNRKDRMDNEFFFIGKLANVMKKANFTELEPSTIDRVLKEHTTRHLVRVSVNSDKYDVLRVWVLGRELQPVKKTFMQSIYTRILGHGSGKMEPTYQRLIIATRLKKDDKLMLKAFKNIPINSLEQILPEKRIRISRLDKLLISSFVGVSGLGLAAKFMSYLAHVHVQWLLVVSAATALGAVRVLTVYKNRKANYLTDMNRTLYYNNIANNRGLLALLVDRAEDELFKEAIATYTFLLTHRQPSIHDLPSSEQTSEALGNITQDQLERLVEGWVHSKTGASVRFDATDALKFLSDLGLLQKDYNNCLSVLPLDTAMRQLPLSVQTLVDRDDETDIVEGYDRDAFDREVVGVHKEPLNPLARFNIFKKEEV